MIRRLLRSVIVSSLAASAALALDPATTALLERAGKRVERFWQDYASVTCTEAILQSRLSPEGKVLQEDKAAYDYLVLMQAVNGELNLEESRLQQGKPGNPPERPLLTTQGFATMLLVFHPQFQANYEFSPVEDDAFAGRPLARIRFSQKRGARPLAVLQLRGREYPIEWAGTAWLDPESGMVLRMETSLKNSMEDLGLKQLTSSVQYGPVAFAQGEQTLLLPVRATVEVRTARSYWRNLHEFSAYKQFSVATSVQIGDLKE
jgi:hypothetical protein